MSNLSTALALMKKELIDLGETTAFSLRKTEYLLKKNNERLRELLQMFNEIQENLQEQTKQADEEHERIKDSLNSYIKNQHSGFADRKNP